MASGVGASALVCTMPWGQAESTTQAVELAAHGAPLERAAGVDRRRAVMDQRGAEGDLVARPAAATSSEHTPATLGRRRQAAPRP